MKSQLTASLALALIAAVPTAQAEVYEVGNSWLGMKATGTATTSGTATYYRFDAQGNMEVRALGFITAKAAEAQLAATLYNTSQAKVVGVLKIIGKNVSRIDGTFNTSGTARTPAIVAGLACPKMRFGIGPLTLGVKFYANASAWAEGTAAFTLNSNPALPPTASLKCGPQAEAVAGGEIDLSLVIVRGGVNGSVRVAKAALNGVLNVDFAQGKGQANVVWSRWDPAGSIVGFVQVRLLFFKKTWSKTLVSWNGQQSDKTLINKPFTLRYKKPTGNTSPNKLDLAPVL